jgi:hypothetical protein
MEYRQAILGSVHLPSPWKEVGDSIALLDDIDGARFDDESGRLIIWGPTEKNGKAKVMPPLLIDDFVVSLKILRAGQNPGVSIGTVSGRIPTRNDIDRILQTGHLPVEYIPPSTAGTHMGSVLFEVDRTLKALAHGEDNITGQKVSSSVPGYCPVPRLLREDNTMKPGEAKPLGLWWFVPDESEVAFDGYTMRFTSYRMKVEYRALVKDPAIAEFGTHMSEHFEEFAKEFVVFRELVRLHKLVQVARWYEDSGFPTASFVTEYPFLRVDTPDTTHALQTLVSSRTTPGSYPGSYYVEQQVIIGGVDLSPRNAYVPASSLPAPQLVPGIVTPKLPGSISRFPSWTAPPRYGTISGPVQIPSFAAPIMAARPTPNSYGWTATVSGKTFAVVSIPVK